MFFFNRFVLSRLDCLYPRHAFNRCPVKFFFFKSIDRFQVRAAAAGGGHRLVRTATVDPERVSAAGRNMLMILEQQTMGQVGRRLVSDINYVGFSAGHLSPAISAIGFLANRPVTSVEFARITSSVESVATTHEVR